MTKTFTLTSKETGHTEPVLGRGPTECMDFCFGKKHWSYCGEGYSTAHTEHTHVLQISKNTRSWTWYVKKH